MEVDNKSSPRHQLHVMLHECGHYLINVFNKEGRFANGHDAKKCDRKKFDHKIDVVEEELEAWHRGWRLGTRLGFFTQLRDKRHYYETRALNMKTYFKWALKYPGWKLNGDEE